MDLPYHILAYIASLYIFMILGSTSLRYYANKYNVSLNDFERYIKQKGFPIALYRLFPKLFSFFAFTDTYSHSTSYFKLLRAVNGAYILLIIGVLYLGLNSIADYRKGDWSIIFLWVIHSLTFIYFYHLGRDMKDWLEANQQ